MPSGAHSGRRKQKCDFCFPAQAGDGFLLNSGSLAQVIYICCIAESSDWVGVSLEFMDMARWIFMNANSGFSLVEIILSMAIASVVIFTAAPALTQFVEKNRLASTTNNVVLSLNFARSEAIKRRTQVTMRRNGGTAGIKIWEDGWVVFADNNGDGNQDTGDLLLATFPQLEHGYTLRTGHNFKDWVAYLPTGRSRSGGGLGNDTFRVCPPDENVSNASKIAVSQTGRPRLRKTSVQCP